MKRAKLFIRHYNKNTREKVTIDFVEKVEKEYMHLATKQIKLNKIMKDEKYLTPDDYQYILNIDGTRYYFNCENGVYNYSHSW